MGKLDEGLKFKYEPIWKEAPLDMKFHYYETLADGTKVLKEHTENYKLVKSIEELKEFQTKAVGKMVGFDTETTGLSYGQRTTSNKDIPSASSTRRG